jgi:hypothetical protein
LRTDAVHRTVRARREGIVAWRFWDVETGEGATRLRSPFRSVTWPAGEPLHAECLGLRLAGRSSARAHAPPGDGCRCGVYGATYRELRTFLRTKLIRPAAAPVLGSVLLWGEIVADDYGWRAADAYPERVLVPTLSRRAFATAAALEEYGVPVEIVDVGEMYSALNPATRARAVR